MKVFLALTLIESLVSTISYFLSFSLNYAVRFRNDHTTNIVFTGLYVVLAYLKTLI